MSNIVISKGLIYENNSNRGKTLRRDDFKLYIRSNNIILLQEYGVKHTELKDVTITNNNGVYEIKDNSKIS